MNQKDREPIFIHYHRLFTIDRLGVELDLMQAKINAIVEAIQRHKPIRFEYLREGKPTGHREGNPHVIYEGTTKEGTERIYLHLVQTGGVSDTITTFSEWRMFILDFIEDVEILEDSPSFIIDKDYNPHSPYYTRAIAKI